MLASRVLEGGWIIGVWYWNINVANWIYKSTDLLSIVVGDRITEEWSPILSVGGQPIGLWLGWNIKGKKEVNVIASHLLCALLLTVSHLSGSHTLQPVDNGLYKLCAKQTFSPLTCGCQVFSPSNKKITKTNLCVKTAVCVKLPGPGLICIIAVRRNYLKPLHHLCNITLKTVQGVWGVILKTSTNIKFTSPQNSDYDIHHLMIVKIFQKCVKSYFFFKGIYCSTEPFIFKLSIYIAFDFLH